MCRAQKRSKRVGCSNEKKARVQKPHARDIPRYFDKKQKSWLWTSNPKRVFGLEDQVGIYFLRNLFYNRSLHFLTIPKLSFFVVGHQSKNFKVIYQFIPAVCIIFERGRVRQSQTHGNGENWDYFPRDFLKLRSRLLYDNKAKRKRE